MQEREAAVCQLWGRVPRSALHRPRAGASALVATCHALRQFLGHRGRQGLRGGWTAPDGGGAHSRLRKQVPSPAEATAATVCCPRRLELLATSQARSALSQSQPHTVQAHVKSVHKRVITGQLLPWDFCTFYRRKDRTGQTESPGGWMARSGSPSPMSERHEGSEEL